MTLLAWALPESEEPRKGAGVGDRRGWSEWACRPHAEPGA